MIRIEWFRSTRKIVSLQEDQEASENFLLARITKKDRDAFSKLYERFQRPLFRYLFHLIGHKELAEDVLQEVMLIVWQKAHTFQGKTQASSWIFGIAHHQAFKALRRGTDTAFIELEAIQELLDDAPDPETNLLQKCTHEEIIQALGKLTPEHREVLELAFFQDFTGQQIAAIVGIPLGTVKSRLSYARRVLKATLLCNGWEV